MNHEWRIASATRPRPLPRNGAALPRSLPARYRRCHPRDTLEDGRRSAQRFLVVESENGRVAVAADLRDHEVDVDARFRERARDCVTEAGAILPLDPQRGDARLAEAR